MDTFIPFARPSIGSEEEAAVLEVLHSGWLTTGPVTDRFEKDFRGCTDARHALAVSSATAGLHLCLEAVGVRPGTRVITTPYTFAATAEVIRYLGAHPLFVDVDASTANMDPGGVEQAVRDGAGDISAVLPVHVAGLCCDMPPIVDSAHRVRAAVVEDAAHCSPASEPRPREADARVYSFYATKTMTTGEGGMVTTDSDEMAARIRTMRLHGIDRDVWDRYTSPSASWRYDIVDAGYKYNMPDILAAVGVEQLKKVDRFRRRRREIAARYITALADRDYLQMPLMREEHDFHLFMVQVVPGRLTMDRDEVIDEMHASGIGCSVHFIPLHTMRYYRATYGLRPDSFPVALSISQRSISLPIYPDLSDAEVDRVITSLRRIGDRAYRKAG